MYFLGLPKYARSVFQKLSSTKISNSEVKCLSLCKPSQLQIKIQLNFFSTKKFNIYSYSSLQAWLKTDFHLLSSVKKLVYTKLLDLFVRKRDECTPAKFSVP